MKILKHCQDKKIIQKAFKNDSEWAETNQSILLKFCRDRKLQIDFTFVTISISELVEIRVQI
jgi:hypothetical protein